MSAEAVMRVLKHSKTKGSDRTALLVIAWHVDKDSGEAWVGMNTIARECNVDERSARRCVQNAERMGELQIVRGGGMQSNRYRIVTPDAGDTPPPDAHVTPPLTPVTPPPLTQATGDPGHMRQGTPDAGDRTPLTPVTGERTSKGKSKSESRLKTPLPPGFEISARVKAWASEKGFDRLEEHFDAFTGKARAHNYRYADWDAAFMEAIRADWAKLRQNGNARQWQPGAAAVPVDWYGSDHGWQAKGRELKIEDRDFLRLQARICVAMGDGPWVDTRNATLMRIINEIQEAA